MATKEKHLVVQDKERTILQKKYILDQIFFLTDFGSLGEKSEVLKKK